MYFLSRGCFVTSIEHDESWTSKIQNVAITFGYEGRLDLAQVERPYDLRFRGAQSDFDLVLIDGRDRVKCLNTVIDSLQSVPAECQPILILDNTERVSGKYSSYMPLLSDYALINFEMPFVFGAPVTEPESRHGLNVIESFPTNGLSANAYRGRAGNGSKGRLITTIAVPKCRGQFTTQGVPLV